LDAEAAPRDDGGLDLVLSPALILERITMKALHSPSHFNTCSGSGVDTPAVPHTPGATPYKHFFQNFVEAHSGRIDAQSGYLRLDAGRAVRLVASRPGVLRIAQGRIWATFDHAAKNDGPRAGDYFANRGEGLPLLAGQSVLIESFALGDAAAAYFSWEPLAPPRPCAAAAPARWAMN
jgi:hypothetical protein